MKRTLKLLLLLSLLSGSCYTANAQEAGEDIWSLQLNAGYNYAWKYKSHEVNLGAYVGRSFMDDLLEVGVGANAGTNVLVMFSVPMAGWIGILTDIITNQDETVLQEAHSNQYYGLYLGVNLMRLIHPESTFRLLLSPTIGYSKTTDVFSRTDLTTSVTKKEYVSVDGVGYGVRLMGEVRLTRLISTGVSITYLHNEGSNLTLLSSLTFHL